MGFPPWHSRIQIDCHLIVLCMESCLGHSHMMMFPLKCIGKKQHQKLHFIFNGDLLWETTRDWMSQTAFHNNDHSILFWSHYLSAKFGADRSRNGRGVSGQTSKRQTSIIVWYSVDSLIIEYVCNCNKISVGDWLLGYYGMCTILVYLIYELPSHNG